MEKLTITAHLSTPIVTGGGYRTLDALLASVLFDELGDVEAAHGAVPIQCDSGLFYASAMNATPTSVGAVGFVANLRAQHELDPGLIRKDKSGAKLHRAIGTKSRDMFGPVMNTYRAINTPTVWWDCTGDAARIRELLDRVHFIGKRCASGYGQVTRWEVDTGFLDGIYGFTGEPLRPIPADRYTGDPSHLRVDAAWRPAYWHPAHRAICYVPGEAA